MPDDDRPSKVPKRPQRDKIGQPPRTKGIRDTPVPTNNLTSHGFIPKGKIVSAPTAGTPDGLSSLPSTGPKQQAGLPVDNEATIDPRATSQSHPSHPMSHSPELEEAKEDTDIKHGTVKGRKANDTKATDRQATVKGRDQKSKGAKAKSTKGKVTPAKPAGVNGARVEGAEVEDSEVEDDAKVNADDSDSPIASRLRLRKPRPTLTSFNEGLSVEAGPSTESDATDGHYSQGEDDTPTDSDMTDDVIEDNSDDGGASEPSPPPVARTTKPRIKKEWQLSPFECNAELDDGSICEHREPSENKLRQHFHDGKHKYPPRFPCFFREPNGQPCRKRYNEKEKGKLRDHMNKDHDNPHRYICTLGPRRCSYTTQLRTHLIEHVKREHKAIELVYCDVACGKLKCPYYALSTEGIRKHQKDSHQDSSVTSMSST